MKGAEVMFQSAPDDTCLRKIVDSLNSIAEKREERGVGLEGGQRGRFTLQRLQNLQQSTVLYVAVPVNLEAKLLSLLEVEPLAPSIPISKVAPMDLGDDIRSQRDKWTTM